MDKPIYVSFYDGDNCYTAVIENGKAHSFCDMMQDDAPPVSATPLLQTLALRAYRKKLAS